MDYARPARQGIAAAKFGCHGNGLWARVRFMLKWALRIGILICPLVPLAGQDIDANITTQNRKPSTVADQISDPAERAAFLAMFQHTEPKQMLEQAKSFLARFPQSAFLFQAYEIAARASFGLEDYDAGLTYARQSLTLLPENPLLLVSVADVEAQKHLDDAAISDARDAVEYLDRFSAPGAIAPGSWPELKNKLKATAEFAQSRALLEQALALPNGEERDALLQDCKVLLGEAQTLNPSDVEIAYLFGLAQLASGELNSAAGRFARIYRANGSLASKARESLQNIYTMLNSHDTFDKFVEQATLRDRAASRSQSAAPGSPAVQSLSDYAGSDSCHGCHSSVYRQWSQTGMSRMLRPYAPQNVIGDFQDKNEFYLEDEAVYRHGKAEFAGSREPTLFARMVIRDGRHYFDIRQSDGKLHAYPVDYTIGSKFQQAYATRLPSGEIHVFPIQYSALQKRWINYWKIIDGADRERGDLAAWEKLSPATSYQAVCAVCHTSQLRNVRGGGFDVNNVEFKEPGIGCEMCHGPSAQHVMDMTANEPYPKRAIDPPVNFNDLGNRDFVRICSQCHMQSAVRASGPSGELNYSRSGGFFPRNPSIPFGEFSRIGFYKDGRFRQTTFIVEALQRSQCFKRGQVSCGTCHDPHGHDAASNLTSVKFRDQPDLMCTNCHTQFQNSAALAAHTRHRADSDGSRCVSCHMPRIMDAILFRARTHQIDDIPDADMTQRFGEEDSPNACLLCHSEKDARWVKLKLQSWRPGAR
jgi:predicted CXXCH cytochrome family protein